MIVGAFVFLCAYYINAHKEDFRFVWSASAPDLVLAATSILVSFFLSAYQLNLFFRHFGASVGFVELTSLTMSMWLGNLLLPMRGGTGALALYMKKAHGLEFGAFAVIYAGTGLLMALINCGLALLGLILLMVFHGYFDLYLTVVVVGLFGACLYFSVFPPPVQWRARGVFGMVFEVARSWHVLTRNRRLLFLLSFSFVLAALTLAAAFFFIYRALGTPLSVSAVLITSGLGNIANLVPITPGGLGIFDAVTIQIPQMFGLDPPRALAGALAYRFLCMFWGISLGLPGMVYLARAVDKGPAAADRDQDA